MATNNKEEKLLELFHLLPELEQNSTLDFMEYLSSRKRQSEEWVADNSPLTEEEKTAIEQANEDITNGDVVSWEDIKRELNL